MIDDIFTNPSTLLSDQDKCIDILADSLKHGCLNLIIGAGVSLSSNQYASNPIDTLNFIDLKKSRIPDWAELTKRCCEDVNISFDDSLSYKNDYLQSRLDDVYDFCNQNHKDFDLLIEHLLFKDAKIKLKPYANYINPIKSGFPSWIDLTVNSCFKSNIDIDTSKLNQNSYLLGKLEAVRLHCKKEGINFHSLIKDCLYENVVYDIDSLSSKLLIAIGALIMNSTKSSLTNIINYNFDDLLEWYLTYHGYDIQIITDTNHLISTSDAVIYHPHGFIPNSEKFEEYESEKIILSKRDYIEANWNQNFWNSIQHNIFSNKINLFIGLSGEDTHLESICQYSYDKIILRERLLGIMILNKSNRDEIIENQNIQNGIVSYYIDDYSELPDLLLKISRKARNIT